MEIKLEKGLAIPPRLFVAPPKSPETIALEEALKAMVVGDSFQLDDTDGKMVNKIRSIAKRLEVKIACRTIDNEEGLHVAVRCWRME